MNILKCKRGQVFYADLSPVIGSEQGGLRPVVILQNDIGNIYSPTTIVAAVTSAQTKANLPTHVALPLFKESTVLLEQIRTIDKRRLKSLIATVDENTMNEIDKALKISLGVAL